MMMNRDEWRMKLDPETYNVMRESGGHLGHLFDDEPKGRALKNQAQRYKIQTLFKPQTQRHKQSRLVLTHWDFVLVCFLYLCA